MDVMGRQYDGDHHAGHDHFQALLLGRRYGRGYGLTSGAFRSRSDSGSDRSNLHVGILDDDPLSGTAGTNVRLGPIEWSDYDDASATTLQGNLNMRLAPTATPATVAVDTTVARSLTPTYTSSVSTASMTAHAAFLEAIT